MRALTKPVRQRHMQPLPSEGPQHDVIPNILLHAIFDANLLDCAFINIADYETDTSLLHYEPALVLAGSQTGTQLVTERQLRRRWRHRMKARRR